MAGQDPGQEAQGAAAAAAEAAAALAAAWEAAKFRGVLPSLGQDVAYLGKNVASNAEDVWNWVSGNVSKKVSFAGHVLAASIDDVKAISSAYAGETLKASISLTQDLGIAVANQFTSAFDTLNYMGAAVANSINGLGHLIGAVDGVVTGIENITIPNLLAEIIHVGASIEPLILQGLGNVETWTMDNVYNPVQTMIIDTAADIYRTIQGTADVVVATAQGLVDSEVLARIEALASTDALVAAIGLTAALAQTWVDECGAPMCSYAGPNTDLGKFLKLLNLAGEAALLAELASLDGAGIENMLRALVSLSHGVIDDVDALFTGGETVGSLLAHAGG